MSRGRSAFRAALLAAGLALAPALGGAQEPIRAEAEAVLKASPADVRAVLLDLEGFARWFPTLVEWRVLSRGEREARVYGRQDFPWPAEDRDYVARYRWWSEGDVFLLEATGESGAEPAAPPGVVRLERFRSEWRVTPHASGGTLARYTAEGPVSGRLARWLATIAWRRETGRVLEGLARALREAGASGGAGRPPATEPAGPT
ncbi:MAG: SRPBCC family protein [Myxococcota bacterium]